MEKLQTENRHFILHNVRNNSNKNCRIKNSKWQLKYDQLHMVTNNPNVSTNSFQWFHRSCVHTVVHLSGDH